MKTTIMLRDELYRLLKTEGKKDLSEKINQALYEHLVLEKTDTDMFGVDKKYRGMNLDDIRDHDEPDV
ncbi:hypothetical protein HY572_04225 [Candidatus Micrarchaeota archaeon]|nr:hypothetical protein [Candidatus Micrarchaeota archaeon]